MNPTRLLVGVLIRTVALLVVISLGSSEGVAFDDAIFFALLLLVPAVVGLAVGGLVHRLQGAPDAPTA